MPTPFHVIEDNSTQQAGCAQLVCIGDDDDAKDMKSKSVAHSEHVNDMMNAQELNTTNMGNWHTRLLHLTLEITNTSKFR